MKKVFIIHGFGGIPNGGWFPWLMGELAKEGIFTCSLPMPKSENPILSEWLNAMNMYIEPDENVFILGHSLGAPAVLRYLETLPEGKKLGGVVLVAGFLESLDVNNPNSDFRKIDHFVNPGIDFTRIKNKANNFVAIHGSNDTIVPFSNSEKISEKLGCELVRVEGGDHFSQKTEPICYKLPEALDALNKMMGI